VKIKCRFKDLKGKVRYNCNQKIGNKLLENISKSDSLKDSKKSEMPAKKN
jgi:hypothetical protein